jgi:two-component sensor histidine kinase
MLQKTSIGDQRAWSRDDLATSITAIPANARQRKVALGVFIFLVVIAAVNAPVSLIPLGPAHSFIPVVQAIMCTANLLTAVFLLVQYSLYPQHALLALAGGFVFSALFALLHTLAFPSAHSSAAQIGDKLSSPTWLFAFWQITFALSVIIYALSKGKPLNQSGRSTRVEIGVTIACVVMVTGVLTWVATAGVGYLPPLHQTQVQRTPLALHVEAFVLLLNAMALAVLFVRRYTLLDQWLMVTLVAWLPHLVMGSLFISIRFSEGWYLARVFALFAGSSLLVVLLTETLLLHRRYEQHQRQLIAELDHRVKNVLAQVDGAVTSTGEGSRSIKDFIRSVRGRIQSMAAAHTLLSENSWRSVALDNLVLAELAPYATDTNVKITGTDVMLSSAETQALAKVLHELATNAAKYGALSIPRGEVSVSWDCKPNGQQATLILEWHELGGPPVASKSQSSYGTDLIRNLIPHELGGTVDLAFVKEGVNCRIEFPLKQRDCPAVVMAAFGRLCCKSRRSNSVE